MSDQHPKTRIIKAISTPTLTLVLENGHEISLSGAEVYEVGRRDLGNGWDPAVDLAPFGGERGGVSRQHARITFQNNAPFLEDLGSSNGTAVNGLKLTGKPHPLFDGNTIVFGRITVVFKQE